MRRVNNVKVLFFANTDWYLYNFRRDLAQALRDQGNEVILLSPAGEYAARLQELGFRWIDFPLSRRGMNPLEELRSLARLVRLYRREDPDLVQHFTIKCVLYGTLAARRAGIRAVVNSITGLGYVFLPGRPLKKVLRFFVRIWYRTVLRGSQVIFENEDDRQAFLQFGFIRPSDGHLIPGVGVDTRRFTPAPFPSGQPVVLLAARLLWDKGIGEFVEAARLLRRADVPARFALAGRTDPGNPASIPEAQINAWADEGLVEWWGWIEDMPATLAKASIVCLPSYYREGLPTVLMEASACGRPVVTTDWPGCRDAVQDGISGFLVRERDAASLSDALRKLIVTPGLCSEMGAAGRHLAEEMFSSEKVLAQITAVYQAALLKGR
jgi:glycosyltransferase involved in cell wall biosynthesis